MYSTGLPLHWRFRALRTDLYYRYAELKSLQTDPVLPFRTNSQCPGSLRNANDLHCTPGRLYAVCGRRDAWRGSHSAPGAQPLFKGRPQFYVVRLPVFSASMPIGLQTVPNAPASSLATLYEVGGRNQRSAEFIVIDWRPNRCSIPTRQIHFLNRK